MKMAVWATHLPFILCIAVIFLYLETAHAQGNNCPRPEPCQPGDRLPDVDNCRKYFECNKGGRRWRHPSCKRQQNFDSVTLECVDEENANCAVNCVVGQIQTETVRDPCSPPPVPCDLGTVEQNFKNCSSFYICEGDSWSERPCRQEYLFDPATKLCVPQELSACEETCVLIDEPIDLPDDFFPFPPASDPPVVTPYPEFTITPQQDFPVTDIAPISSSINETIIDLACDPRADCPPFIRLPDPKDCTRFFFCVQGVRAVQPCQQGQQFDAVTLQCQERNRATCMPSCDSFKITTRGGLTLPDYKLSTSPDDNAETTTIDIARDPIFGRLAQAMLKLACNLPPLCFLNEQIPVPGNCSAYYYCDTAVSRTYKVGFCPQGQQFDIVQRECARGNVVCMPALPCDPTGPQTSTVLATETSTVNVPTTSTITYPQASTLPDTDPPSPDTTSTIRPPSTRPSKAPTRVTEPPSTLPELVTTDPQVPVAPVTVKPEMCESNVDSDGLNWISTVAGQEAVLPCPHSSKGSIIRRCVLDANGKATWEEQVDFCVDKEYLDILNLAETIVPGDKASLERTKDISEKLKNTILQDVAINKELSAGNLNASVEAVLTLSGIDIFGATVDPEVTQVTLINTAFSADGLLSLNNSNSWQKILQQNKDGAVKLLNATDNIGRGIASTLPQGSTMNISLENFAIQTVALPRNLTKAVSFNVDISEGAPLLQLNYSSTDSSTAIDSIEVQPETLRAMARSAKTENLVMWTTYHATMDMLMPATKNMIINSRILALTVKDLESGFTFQPPITLRFTPLNKTLLINETYCSFWKYTSMTSGYWSQEGCTLMKTNANQTTCECNHLTNFAVLVSPYLADGLHARILSLISLIGCLLSILGCFATMVFYMLAWKEVKSQHAIVLLNLCAVLIIANVVFLVGIDKVRYELVCTIVAALLHYFWLVAFMSMLADGVMLILNVVYVFHVKRLRETVLLLVIAWLFPAVVVGIILGMIGTEGYGTEDYCWLERSNSLYAAFIAPMAAIIVANSAVFVKVLHIAATSKSNQLKERSQVRAVIWNIMVILPLLGVGWIFGLLSVNEETVIFQYVFAIANSLQGFFIFIFHCVLNKKVRQGISSRMGNPSTTSGSQATRREMLKLVWRKNDNFAGTSF